MTAHSGLRPHAASTVSDVRRTVSTSSSAVDQSNDRCDAAPAAPAAAVLAAVLYTAQYCIRTGIEDDSSAALGGPVPDPMGGSDGHCVQCAAAPSRAPIAYALHGVHAPVTARARGGSAPSRSAWRNHSASEIGSERGDRRTVRADCESACVAGRLGTLGGAGAGGAGCGSLAVGWPWNESPTGRRGEGGGWRSTRWRGLCA